MRYGHYGSQLLEADKQRQRYFYINVILVLVVLLQSIFLVSNRQSVRTVIVPPQLGQSFWIDEHAVSSSYLTEMARFITGTVLTVTPENVNTQAEALLRFAHPQYRGDLQQRWQTWSERIEAERVSHVFLPQQVDANARELTAVVAGELITFMGNEKLQQAQVKYQLHFIYQNGRLWLSQLDSVNTAAKGNAS